jgi:hypothetical protein
MTRKAASPRSAAPHPGRWWDAVPDAGEIAELAGEVASHRETGPVLSGGDLDADWRRAHDGGDEAVGGSVATPDQDVVDEIGRALGVPQDADAELRTSEETLRARDRFRWHLEREAADQEEGRARPRRSRPT